LLSTDDAVCRQLLVTGATVAGSTGPSCKHADGTFNPANGTLPVQLAPYAETPNKGLEYKVWVIPTGSATISTTDFKVLDFSRSNAKTDNFKAQATVVQQGSCQPASSLSVLVSGTNVTSYVPKGAWSRGSTGISVVNVEGSSITPLTGVSITTPNVVNSCASNPLTGQTVCTANNKDVYTLSGTGPVSTLTSGASGTIKFSGGLCTNCGIAMDSTNSRAVVGLSIGGVPGFQFLNLGTSTFEPPFPTMSTMPTSAISEDPLLDPIRNLLLSAAENNTYEMVDVTTSTSPTFFENAISIIQGGDLPKELDSSGEDCSTGIVLAPVEFTEPSEVYIADISNPLFARFVPGMPGAWTAPSQVQTLTNSFLSDRASGIAVAQGTHTGVVTGEFDGDAITAISLPAVSGGVAVPPPAIGSWMTCRVDGFNLGRDPHTVTAYQSPNGGDAIGLFANDGATMLAKVDLTKMLALPETAPGSHLCLGGTLPSGVVIFIPVP
jgi:hypothetical protein